MVNYHVRSLGELDERELLKLKRVHGYDHKNNERETLQGPFPAMDILRSECEAVAPLRGYSNVTLAHRRGAVVTIWNKCSQFLFFISLTDSDSLLAGTEFHVGICGGLREMRIQPWYILKKGIDSATPLRLFYSIVCARCVKYGLADDM